MRLGGDGEGGQAARGRGGGRDVRRCRGRRRAQGADQRRTQGGREQEQRQASHRGALPRPFPAGAGARRGIGNGGTATVTFTAKRINITDCPAAPRPWSEAARGSQGRCDQRIAKIGKRPGFPPRRPEVADGWGSAGMSTPLYQLKAEFFKTLGHPARIRVLELLSEREHAVSEMLPEVGIERRTCPSSSPCCAGRTWSSPARRGRPCTTPHQPACRRAPGGRPPDPDRGPVRAGRAAGRPPLVRRLTRTARLARQAPDVALLRTC